MKHPKVAIALVVIAAMSTGLAVSQTIRPGTPSMTSDANGTSHVPVTLSGGHDTDPHDHGRPVVLVAAGLNVPADVFRRAFSGVTPATGGRGPTGDEARRNKAALLKVLAPYGVTNDRLDEVSDYYRYRPENGRLWKHVDAKVTAIIRDGKIVSLTIVNPGAGYTTPPTIDVPGFPTITVSVKLKFTTDLAANGSISQVSLQSQPD